MTDMIDWNENQCHLLVLTSQHFLLFLYLDKIIERNIPSNRILSKHQQLVEILTCGFHRCLFLILVYIISRAEAEKTFLKHPCPKSKN